MYIYVLPVNPLRFCQCLSRCQQSFLWIQMQLRSILQIYRCYAFQIPDPQNDSLSVSFLQLPAPASCSHKARSSYPDSFFSGCAGILSGHRLCYWHFHERYRYYRSQNPHLQSLFLHIRSVLISRLIFRNPSHSSDIQRY